jgi:hypothetical protein
MLAGFSDVRSCLANGGDLIRALFEDQDRNLQAAYKYVLELEEVIKAYLVNSMERSQDLSISVGFQSERQGTSSFRRMRRSASGRKSLSM